MNDDLLPNELKYSLVHCDRWKSPRDPDAEVKMGETDGPLEDVPLPNLTGISVLAYDADGNMYELSGKEPDEDARERLLGVMDELQTDG